MNELPHELALTCPAPHAPGDRVLLAHGEGARLTRRLIREVLLPAFDNPFLRSLQDAAILPAEAGPIVLTTDSSVVSPLFFPGGDIGKLAVFGTVNDLAVCGAEPLFLSVALILEEGLPRDTLQRVVQSIGAAARLCGVQVVTGDTKVVPRGAADQLFITTTGLGRLRPGCDWGAHRVRPGDRVLVSGALGDHGLAILAAREQLDFETPPTSDAAPVTDLVRALTAAGVEIHFLRDPTRGGVAAVLHEVAEATGLGITLTETALPVSPVVQGACALLGLDPLHVANEGKLVAVVAEAAAVQALAVLRSQPQGQQAAIIAEVVPGPPQVLVRGALGVLRVLDEPSGAPLPRIC